MAPPRKDLAAHVHLKLSTEDLGRLDRVAHDLARRDRSTPSRTRAARWAIRELAVRLFSERAATAAGDPAAATVGPMTPPPE